ncbi:MAG: response regulator transcription factor [Acetobacteraceae bacterium]|nr:response regulator transcription factor [Acetobacteraceae bacterium]
MAPDRPNEPRPATPSPGKQGAAKLAQVQLRPALRKPAQPAGRIRVLIVEDVRTVAVTVQSVLLQASMEVELAESGAQAWGCKRDFQPDVALIDLGLPDVEGFELVERFAQAGDCGIILLTANDEESARVMALDTGADDYMVKPAPARELVARIRALHRRMNRPRADRMLRIYIDPSQRCLIGAGGGRTALTEAEMAALDTLLDAGGVSVSREWLSRIALKRPLHADDRAVDQLVMKLRRKLASQGASNRVILSARRQGYVIADPSLFRPVPAAEAPGVE